MRLFLDSSVLLAAAGSAQGASRFLLATAPGLGWHLLTSDYCAEETRRNLPKLGRKAGLTWAREIEPALEFVPTRVSWDKPLVFPKAKDRPVLIAAFAAQSDWLLTLDVADFQGNLGGAIYGLRLATPGNFLLEQRQRGRL